MPDSFAVAVDSDDGRPTGFWLQVDGCPNGPSWVEVEYTVDDFVLLGRGWKAFTRSRHLTRGSTWRSSMTETLKVHGCPHVWF